MRTVQAAAVVDTPEFRRWFGQSKVVDSSGQPLVCYHGSGQRFDEFLTRPGETTEGAAFFTTDRSVAEIFAQAQYELEEENELLVYDVYLRIQNPMRLRHQQVMEEVDINGSRTWIHKFALMKAAVARARAGGYDGIFIADVPEHKGLPAADQWAVFEPTQIKSASRCRRFDPANPSIYK